MGKFTLKLKESAEECKKPNHILKSEYLDLREVFSMLREVQKSILISSEMFYANHSKRINDSAENLYKSINAACDAFNVIHVLAPKLVAFNKEVMTAQTETLQQRGSILQQAQEALCHLKSSPIIQELTGAISEIIDCKPLVKDSVVKPKKQQAIYQKLILGLCKLLSLVNDEIMDHYRLCHRALVIVIACHHQLPHPHEVQKDKEARQRELDQVGAVLDDFEKSLGAFIHYRPKRLAMASPEVEQDTAMAKESHQESGKRNGSAQRIRFSRTASSLFSKGMERVRRSSSAPIQGIEKPDEILRHLLEACSSCVAFIASIVSNMREAAYIGKVKRFLIKAALYPSHQQILTLENIEQGISEHEYDICQNAIKLARALVLPIESLLGLLTSLELWQEYFTLHPKYKYAYKQLKAYCETVKSLVVIYEISRQNYEFPDFLVDKIIRESYAENYGATLDKVHEIMQQTPLRLQDLLSSIKDRFQTIDDNLSIITPIPNESYCQDSNTIRSRKNKWIVPGGLQGLEIHLSGFGSYGAGLRGVMLTHKQRISEEATAFIEEGLLCLIALYNALTKGESYDALLSQHKGEITNIVRQIPNLTVVIAIEPRPESPMDMKAKPRSKERRMTGALGWHKKGENPMPKDAGLDGALDALDTRVASAKEDSIETHTEDESVVLSEVTVLPGATSRTWVTSPRRQDDRGATSQQRPSMVMGNNRGQGSQ